MGSRQSVVARVRTELDASAHRISSPRSEPRSSEDGTESRISVAGEDARALGWISGGVSFLACSVGVRVPAYLQYLDRTAAGSHGFRDPRKYCAVAPSGARHYLGSTDRLSLSRKLSAQERRRVAGGPRRLADAPAGSGARGRGDWQRRARRLLEPRPRAAGRNRPHVSLLPLIDPVWEVVLRRQQCRPLHRRAREDSRMVPAWYQALCRVGPD